jgi:hypothetical protein
LVPPPWLEFTTSEPSLSATRVRPPARCDLPLLPESTKGRRSTWRGARPDSTKQVGQVESASVGWAMKPSGSPSACAETLDRGLVGGGPISMP